MPLRLRQNNNSSQKIKNGATFLYGWQSCRLISKEGYCSSSFSSPVERKGKPMPLAAYFEEFTAAALMNADEVKGFLQQQ
jgi:hypothetical protein